MVSWVDSIPALNYVRDSESLDGVLVRMLVSGFEEVGIIDGGVITLVLYVDNIFIIYSRKASNWRRA